MISKEEYLKDYNAMNNNEKKDYLARVKKWTEETFSELLALADCWQKVPVKDFDEGCRLVSAIINARQFLNNIQRYEAQRAIKKINLFLAQVRKQSGMDKIATRSSVNPQRFKAVVLDEIPGEDGVLRPAKQYQEPEVDNLRPKDFVLYKDRLPEKLRKKGEQELHDMYLELAEYRGTLEVMVENPNIGEEARKDMANKAIEAEQKIRSFWAEVDASLSGENVPETKQDFPMEMKRPGDFTRAEIEAMADSQQKEACRKARVEGNKKYINRNDVKISEEYKEQLKLRIQELIDWDENLPKKTAEVATNAGIFIEGVNKKNSTEEEKVSFKEEKVSGKEKSDPTECVTEAQMKGGSSHEDD